MGIFSSNKDTDYKLKEFLAFPKQPSILRHDFPYFAFPDFSFAISDPVKNYSTEQIRSTHEEDLSSTIGKEKMSYHNRKINNSTLIPWKISHDTETFFVNKESHKNLVAT